MTQQLGRTYKLTVVRQSKGRGFFTDDGNGTEVTKLRMSAKIERSLVKSPNTAEVKIYNLWEDTRAAFEDLPIRVYLAAGYQEDNRLLFVGDVRRGSGSEHDGTEWVTTLKLGDGQRAFSHAKISRSYRPGTPVLAALTDAARSMNLELPREIVASPELAAGIASGAVLSGWASDELTRLLSPYGYSWSIQSGKLQILRDDQVLVGVERVIDQANGMVGTPKMKVPTPTKSKKSKKVKRATVEFEHLLDGTLVPGMRIRLRAESLEGAFKLTKVTYVLDTHGADWTSKCEGIPV